MATLAALTRLRDASAVASARFAVDGAAFTPSKPRKARPLAVAAGVDVKRPACAHQNEAPNWARRRVEFSQASSANRMWLQPTTQVSWVSSIRSTRVPETAPLAEVYPARLINVRRTQYKNPARTRNSYAGQKRAAGNDRRGAEVTRFLAERDRAYCSDRTRRAPTPHTNPPASTVAGDGHWIAAGVSEAKLFRAMTIDNARVSATRRRDRNDRALEKANLLFTAPIRSRTSKPMLRSRRYSCTSPITRETLGRHAPAARP